MGDVIRIPQYEPWRDLAYCEEHYQEWRAQKIAARARGEAWAQLKPPLRFPRRSGQLELPFERIVFEIRTC